MRVDAFTVPSFQKAILSSSSISSSNPLVVRRNNNDMPSSWSSLWGSVGVSDIDNKNNNNNNNNNKNVLEEYASLQVGQVVNVRIGDLRLGRKAWKKRRRSDSPILVPCSILGMNRYSMIVYNIRTLLYKYGDYPKLPSSSSSSQQHQPSSPVHVHNDHKHQIQLSLSRLKKVYKRDTGVSLLSHANAFGYESVELFLEYLWKEYPEQKDLMPLVLNNNNNNHDDDSDNAGNTCSTGYIVVPNVSRVKARQLVQKLAVISMTLTEDDDSTMKHTGNIRVKPPNNNKSNNNNNNNNNNNHNAPATNPLFEWKDLSAAVRIAQHNVDSGRISMGDELNAFVFSYDVAGDNGSPLLTLSMDPPKRNPIRARTQQQQQRPPTQDLNTLQMGEGPFPATVVRVSSKAGASFVDMGVYRNRGKKQGGGTTRVLGMLRFYNDEQTSPVTTTTADATAEEEDIVMTIEDLFVNDTDDDDDEEEIAEDVTDMYETDKDGSMYLIDPVTGERTFLASINDDIDAVEEDDDDEDDEFANMNPQERLNAISEMLSEDDSDNIHQKNNNNNNNIKKLRANKVKEGDVVQVYVHSVFPQSGRFMVTLDENVSGSNAKDVKKAKVAKKKKSKLGPMLLQTIMDSVGMECTGIIQAKSNTGNWYYVQPDNTITDTTADPDKKLPVGVAIPNESDTDESVSDSFNTGDKVRVRIDGIDEARGQLALTLLQAE
eukprot:CAMPEP_0197823292 /NCGR_PEP_ID=MMETSP1437-20131217/614_1 /TAXON_ID=49252 ORGANISM="Eucampia antarctica, Strain CCMP1452" /NCGR_SAMPLE_ID=MMETSP1437 /ASSEMBLY_ACC=CAM_ASM_001096 /LENGTH=714 /DNA_ID=CAMNT_0043422371 /DNA_START=120 /DNA_END=2264 /DNA_ORIENTATION=-